MTLTEFKIQRALGILSFTFTQHITDGTYFTFDNISYPVPAEVIKDCLNCTSWSQQERILLDWFEGQLNDFNCNCNIK